jgi:thiol-disulfide isomerase/thioredoxin
MRKIILAGLMTGILACMPLQAEYRTWTKQDGSTALLNLIGKTGEGKEMKAKFQMRNGKKVNFPVSELSADDAKLVQNWTAPKAVAVGPKSVFDEVLTNQLVKLDEDGKKLVAYEIEKKPTKYYMFYYTASWCGPCKRFSPLLVKFYNEYKPKSDEFEIILISSDDDEASMENYASGSKMNWPQLKLSMIPSFRQKFKHPGGGIPNLVLTDLEGKIIKSSYEGKNYMGPDVVMQHLQSLIK